jgi:hypothetical protein
MDRGAPTPIGKSHSLQLTTFGSRKRQELNGSNLLFGTCQNPACFGLKYRMTRRLSAGVARLNIAAKRHVGRDDLQLINSQLLQSACARGVHTALHCAPHNSD